MDAAEAPERDGKKSDRGESHRDDQRPGSCHAAPITLVPVPYAIPIVSTKNRKGIKYAAEVDILEYAGHSSFDSMQQGLELLRNLEEERERSRHGSCTRHSGPCHRKFNPQQAITGAF